MTPSCLWLDSTQRLLTSADQGSFFNPFDLHLHAADLLVEFPLIRGLVGPPLPPIGEQLGHLADQLLFFQAVTWLVWMPT